MRYSGNKPMIVVGMLLANLWAVVAAPLVCAKPLSATHEMPSLKQPEKILHHLITHNQNLECTDLSTYKQVEYLIVYPGMNRMFYDHQDDLNAVPRRHTPIIERAFAVLKTVSLRKTLNDQYRQAAPSSLLVSQEFARVTSAFINHYGLTGKPRG